MYLCYYLHEAEEVVIETQESYNNRDWDDLVANLADIILDNVSYDDCLKAASIKADILGYTVRNTVKNIS